MFAYFRSYAFSFSKILLIALTFLTTSILPTKAQDSVNIEGLKAWIENFKPIALSQGITEETYHEAFDKMSYPDFSILQKVKNQPEFTNTAASYFKRINTRNIIEGQLKLEKYADALNKIEATSGVDKSILLAIWSVESSYGRALRNPNTVKDIFASLSVLAYADSRRSRFAQNQLIAALKILQSGKIKRSDLVGSWAGAMGHTQFIPTSYLAYGQDIDGEPWPNIWHSEVDALASAANLLKVNGWVSGEDWGYEVNYPYDDINQFANKKLTFAEWEKLNITRADKKNYTNLTNTASLLFPDGLTGPIFLVSKNFSVLKSYNNANRYALLVGLLSNRIAGKEGLIRQWGQ